MRDEKTTHQTFAFRLRPGESSVIETTAKEGDDAVLTSAACILPCVMDDEIVFFGLQVTFPKHSEPNEKKQRSIRDQLEQVNVEEAARQFARKEGIDPRNYSVSSRTREDGTWRVHFRHKASPDHFAVNFGEENQPIHISPGR